MRKHTYIFSATAFREVPIIYQSCRTECYDMCIPNRQLLGFMYPKSYVSCIPNTLGRRRYKTQHNDNR